MIKSILRLVRFDLSKVLKEKKVIILYLLILLYAITRSQYIYIPNLNMIDIVMVIQMNSPFVIIVESFFSIYIGSNLFIEKELSCFIKSRIKYKRNWIISKIASILIINVVIFLVTIIISFITGLIIGGYGTEWGNRILSLPPGHPYAALYSPYKLLLINTIIFTSVMTLLSLISGMIYLKFNATYLGISITLMYMLGSSALSFLGGGAIAKAIIFTNYIIFSRRNYFNTESELMYMTTRQSLIYPIIALAVLVVYCVWRVKKFEFRTGDKKYE